MSEAVLRIGAIVRADFLIRFRRVSTAVIFVVLSAIAYFWIPDPRTGRALIQINGQRALYNSAAIGMATALLASIFIGLIGFYVVSNAIRRDLLSRCGFVAASTTMRSSEYIFGKFLGNVVFLTTFIAGFGAVSMAMIPVRGEAPLQPWVFIQQYLLLTPPVIIFVSALAILFEAVPFLSGKFGDVAYFFLWAMSMTVVVAITEKGGNPAGLASFFDFNGFGFLWTYMHAITRDGSLSIGATSFDANQPVYVFQGLKANSAWLIRRIAAGITPLVFVGAAMLFFHRFDPVRVRHSVRHNGAHLFSRINVRFKFLTRIAGRLMPVGRSSPTRSCRSAAGRSSFLRPRLQPMFVIWKFGACALAALGVLAIPIAKSSALPLAAITGSLFIAAAAVALGVISNTPKTFTVLFLTFWYVVVNDKGMTRALDFAGFFGKANGAVIAAYAAIAMVMLAAAEVVHRRRIAA